MRVDASATACEANEGLREFADEEWVLTRAHAVVAQVDGVEREQAEAREQLQPARDLVADARRKEQAGLTAGSRASARSPSSRAARARERVGAPARYLDEDEENAVLREGAATVERQAVEVLVDLHVHLHVASEPLVRNAYDEALGAVNQALALGTTDQAARDMRSRIEVAARDDDRHDGVVIGLGRGWRPRWGFLR